jgi:hypothetical protein
MKTIFTDDAVQDHCATRDRDAAFNAVWSGVDEILKRIDAGTERHLVTHLTRQRVDFDGDRAAATANLHSVHADPDRGKRPTVQIQQGWYLKDLV